MDREWKQVLIIIGVVAILVLGCFAGVKAYSGMDNSLTVVVSGSMQHGDKSEIGVIDTGDMVIMKNKDKGITTYVEGYKSYSQFGEYGDVIIYNRDGNQNPVIHRAIVWIDYKDGIYSAESLKIEDYGDTPDKLWWTDNGSNKGFSELHLNLPVRGSSEHEFYPFYTKDGGAQSGYLTKGDNNNYFDAGTSIKLDGLVTFEQVKAVAGIEIPWVGAIKLFVKGNTEDIQSNTPYCLAFLILDVIAILVIISLIWDIVDRRYYNQ